jgi:hypothetical protein
MDSEIQRIVSIPVEPPLEAGDYDLVSEHYVRPEYHGKFKLLPKQVEALLAYNDVGGVFGPIAVGAGKTLISLLIADDCYRNIVVERYEGRGDRIPRVLLLVPPQVLAQLRGTDIPMCRKYTRFSCPVHLVSGISRTKRMTLAKSQMRGLYVMTYSILQGQDASDMLELIQPSLIICDEAHCVSGARNSARAKRFKRYVDRHEPQVVALSGTMTSKSPKDYHYIARACLKANNFLPNPVAMADAWATVIDSNASSLSEFRSTARPSTGPLLPLLAWAKEQFPKEDLPVDLIGFRKAAALRMRTTPGVTKSKDDELGCSLYIENLPVAKDAWAACDGYAKQQELIKKLNDEWLTPDDDEIEEAMHVWKWRYEIEGAGFYNQLYWPNPDVLAKRKRVSEEEAKSILSRCREYHELRQEYNKHLREFLRYSARPHMDTPALVGGEMFRNGGQNVPEPLFRSWSKMKQADFEQRIDRDSRAVRVCDYKIRHLVSTLPEVRKSAEGGGLVVWYYHTEIGLWACEALKEAGIEAVHCPAGPEWNEYLRDSGAHRGKVLVCSVNAHGTGKNLQHGFNTCYYLQWPRPSVTAEQSIGRFHRTGQKADEVVVYTCNSGEFDEVTFGATLNDAAYTQQVMRDRQKLLYATYDPTPKTVPYTVLYEWGTNPKTLTEDGRELLMKMSEGGLTR